MRMLLSLIRVAVLGLSFLIAFSVSATGIQHAFLVQNSGWMEPFYSDPASQLKPLVVAVAKAATNSDDKIFTLAFNQSKGENISPALLGSSTGTVEMSAQLGGLSVARKGAGLAFADTDFTEAVSKTITGPFQTKPGIIWIFTNNKNSPNNDTQTTERNRDFYRLLHLEPSIVKTLVFPLNMPVKGQIFDAQGLMIYALAYGNLAAEVLDRIVTEGRLKQVLTNTPARLKPVDKEAVRIVPELVKDAPNINASLAEDNQTIILDVEANGLMPKVTLQAKLENLFYPYVIKKAVVESYLISNSDRTLMTVNPSAVSDLQPGEKQTVDVSFTLPMAQIPSVWSAQALTAMGKQVILPLTVEMGLKGQQLELSQDFATKLNFLFPGDPISEVFLPPESVQSSQVRVPLVVRIQYPLAPVFAVVFLLLFFLACLVFVGILSQKNKRFEIVVNGNRRIVLLKPFSKIVINDSNGRMVGTIKRGLGNLSLVDLIDGNQINTTPRQ